MPYRVNINVAPKDMMRVDTSSDVDEEINLVGTLEIDKENLGVKPS